MKRLLPILIAASVALQIFEASGGDTLPGFYQDPGLSPFRSTVNHNSSEHIDPFTGMLQLHNVDATLPGNGGFDLIVQRSFNSPTASYGGSSDTTSYNKTPNIGVGWSLLIGGRIFNPASACWGGTGNQLIFETPDGGRQALLRTFNNDFISAARWKAVCVSNGVQVFAPNGTRYDLLQVIAEAIPNSIQGSPFYYPTLIQDKNGNSATLSYVTQAPTTLLSGVSTSDGRTITFNYTLTGTVYLLTQISTSQGSWRFYYQQAFANISNQGVAYLLTQVAPPAASSWYYYYNSCLVASAGSCSINQLTYPENGSIYYGYNLVNFNDNTGSTPVVSSKTGVNGSWSFSYYPGGTGSYDMTTVNSPLGTITYKHFGFNTVGPGTTWKIGLLAERATSNLQTETYSWDKQQISPYPTSRGYVNYNDGVTYAPILTQRSIVRTNTTYTTSYSNFDANGNPQTITESGDRSHTTTRAYCVNLTKWLINVPSTETTSGTGTISRVFDGNCNMTNETRYGVPTNFFYDSTGNLASRNDARGNSTSYTGYYRGTPQTEYRPEGVTISRTIDSNGNVLSQTDGAGNTYRYGYDAIRRLISYQTPVGSTTTLSWAGNSSRTATRGSYTEALSLDGFANATSVTRSGIRTQFAYDAFANKTYESLPGGSVGTNLSRDILGRVTSMRNSDGTSRTFTYNGSAVSILDERGRTTTYRYNAFGDPDRRFLVGIDLPDGYTVVINRDDLGNITSVSKAGYSRTYGYNASYFLTSITDPETGTTTFGRDALGNMTSSSVGGRQTTYSYDGLNRLIAINYPNGNNVGISYFGNGRTSSITDADASRSYGYDANANLTSETLNVGGQTFTIGYSYNANDALSTVTYPRTNDVVSYSPNALGRPTSASPFITSVGYFNSGNLSSMSYANGVTTTYAENTRNWPSSFAASKGGTFLSKSYTYDGVGNVTQLTDQLNSARSMSLGYDAISQLTSATGPWGSATISYDAAGNISTYNVGASGRNYTYSNNKLSTFQSQFFSYDGYGNVTNDNLHVYQYDDASNLTCIDCPASGQIAYAYDGNNRRVMRTQNGATTYFVHASNGDLLLEYTPATNTTVEHVYVQGKRVATKTIQ
jgi:YD repeat-containing protein